MKYQKNKELLDLTKKLWHLTKKFRVNSRPKCVPKLKFCVSVSKTVPSWCGW